MTKVSHIEPVKGELFEVTIQKELDDIERKGFEILDVQVLSNSRGIDGFEHCAFVIYEETNEPKINQVSGLGGK